MSADPDKDTACPKADKAVAGTGLTEGDTSCEVTEKKRKKLPRSVRFPNENKLVTQYFEPANPWQDVPTTTRAQLAAEYLEACRRHNTTPIDSVLQQIRELPENSIGGGNRAARLSLAECSLAGSAPVDALEAVLRKVQFRRVEMQHCEVDDEGAEALFDMIEYYESANVVCISGPRQFGIRGWQAACRMIKKSAEMIELEVCESALCASHAPVLVRALRAHSCRLRALCLQRASLQGEPLLCLVIALKSNTSIRELRLPDNQLRPSDAQQLASLLKLNLNIQLLDLSNNEIQDDGTGHIADALVGQAAQTPPSTTSSPLSPLHYPLGGYEARVGLAFLVLWNNQLTKNCAPHLSRALRASPSLCVLNIGRNKLGGSCLPALCGGAVVSVGLQGAGLGPPAARALPDLLRGSPNLQRLDLRDNKLGVAGLQAILNAMKDNTTVTQIDLDDPADWSSQPDDGSIATATRLSREIAALCRRNEPPATEPERTVHRKISLTCHSSFLAKPPASEIRCGASRLRSPAPSPAPSPAGSPIPYNHSRFSVTRVTPERESSTESVSPSTPTRPGYCLTPSRFKVEQVVEPPQIQIHPAKQKRPHSRFSVTRNYDAAYNPSPPSGSSPSASPTPSVSPVPSCSPTTVLCASPTPVLSSSLTPVLSDSPTPLLSESPTPLLSESPTPLLSESPTPLLSESPTPLLSESPTPEVISALSMTKVFSVSPTTLVFSPTPAKISASQTQSTVPVLSDSSTIVSSDSKTQKILTSSPMTGVNVVTMSSNLPASSTILTCETLTQTPISVSPATNTGVNAITVSEALVTDSFGLVTSEEKANVTTSLTAVPKMSPTLSPLPGMIPISSLSHGVSIDQYINNTGFQIPIGTSPEIYSKNTACGILEKCVSDVSSTTGTNTNPIFSNVTFPIEYNLKNDAAVEPRDDISSEILCGTPSSDTMTGTTTSGTSLDTLSGTTSSDMSICDLYSPDSLVTCRESIVPVTSNALELLYTRSEPMVKGTDVASCTTLSNVGVLCPISVEKSQFELGFGVATIPKPKLDTDVFNTVPCSMFRTSPITDNIEVFLQSDTKTKDDVLKPVAIGSQTNIAAASLQKHTNKLPIKTEADILTKIAEITERVTPKVVETEPKDKPCIKDLERYEAMQLEDDNKAVIDAITSTSRDMIGQFNAPINIAPHIPSFIEVSSKIDFKPEKSIDLDKSMTAKAKQHILPVRHIIKSTDTFDKNSEQTERKDQGPCIDVNTVPIVDSKPINMSDKELAKIVQVDTTGSKSKSKDELKQTELRPELVQYEIATVVRDQTDITSKVEDNHTADLRTPDSDKDKSDTKNRDIIDDTVKNKTYSDIVKSDPKYKDKSEQLTHREEISDSVVKTETKLVKNSVEMSDSNKVDVQIEVTVKKESVQDAAKVHSDQNKDFVNIDDIIIKKDVRTMKQIEAITEDLGNLIQEMKDMSSKSRKAKSDFTVDIVSVDTNKVPGNFNRDVVLKKNKSESSLDSPDLEVSRLMNRKMVGSPFCDSSSSLEISGSSMESLNAIENQHAISSHTIPKQVVIQESVESDTELDRRKDIGLSTGSSIESTSDVTPVNAGNFLNMSVSSNESVSPIIFGKKKKIHDSLSSLEASVSSLDSGRQDKVMVTSADSGIEYSLQHPSENKEDNSSNEGTLTHNSSLRETVKKVDQETLTSSPKRTSSLLDVPALKTKGLDRMRKISWVAPSSSFHIPRVETDKMEKPSHLEKLLSLFQHPTSLFSRGSQSDEERKSASNTPPRKDSSLTSSFWSWGSTIEKDKDDKEDSSEATDSTLSERVQVSFVDESFSKKLDSKTPSTDTENTLSEFQSFPTQTSAESDSKVTDETTDENLVQKCLGLSLNTDKAGSNGNRDAPRASDMTDLNKPNDLNKNYDVSNESSKNDVDENKSENKVIIDNDDDKDEVKLEPIRPRSFAAVLKSSGSENTLDKQPSPESGQFVDKLPSKIIRGIKENISPENTLTSSMTNTKTLAFELAERQVKSQPVVNAVWEVSLPDKIEIKAEEFRTHSDLAPIATIEETCDEAADNTVNIRLEFIDDVKADEKDVLIDGRITLRDTDKAIETVTKELENVDLGKDALSYLIYESQDFEPDTEHTLSAQAQVKESSLAQELKEAEIKQMLDLSPELVIDEAIELPDVFTTKEIKGLKQSPVIPERAKLKKANSLEDLSQRDESEKSSPKTKNIVFKLPETTSPRDIPERRAKLRTMSGSSPKSLPESLNKPSPLMKMDSAMKKRKKVSSLGKMAKDSLLALNMSEEEIAEYRRSYVTSAESLRSLESVSEDACSQSGTSVDSRCRSCLRTSQESLMSLESITEDCKCGSDCEKAGRSLR